MPVVPGRMVQQGQTVRRGQTLPPTARRINLLVKAAAAAAAVLLEGAQVAQVATRAVAAVAAVLQAQGVRVLAVQERKVACM